MDLVVVHGLLSGVRKVLVRSTLLSLFLSPLGENGLAERVDKSGLWTELALAYAVHKSFIFIRVPLTAAVTPKIVKVLRGWGWNIGKKGKSKTNITPVKNSTPPPPPPPPAV